MDMDALVVLRSDTKDVEEKFALVATAGYEIRDIVRVRKPQVKSGKLDEMREKRSDVIIFLCPLSPSQKFGIERETGRVVMDFYDLVLRVFELHAVSQEAKVQIELTRLRREMPYVMKEVSVNVRREHPGFSGGGEYIIHSHESNIKRREAKLEKKLMLYEMRKESERERRENVVSLAGYTNSGKSTLFNALSHANQVAENEPFTTLQTKSRRLYINGTTAVLNDTIGFISDLPVELIAPFRVTMKDIVESDLILLVLDVSESTDYIAKKRDVCISTFREIGINRDRTKIITVLNKTDLVDDADERIAKVGIEEPYIKVSALKREGIGELRELISRSLPGV
jgi:GTP-binding protein HflX